MESLLRRLKYYGIGFGIGTVFVIFFFQNRGCSWTPSNRVKNAILDRLIVVSDSTKAQMDKKNITYNSIINALNDGDVEFTKSDKSKKDKLYVIERKDQSFVFSLPDESFISEVFLGDAINGISATKKGSGTIIRVPKDENMIYAEEGERIACQQEQLGLISTKKIYERLKSSGRINFEKSDLSVRPKPEHYITIINKGDTIGMTMIWYKTKLNISTFHHSSLEPYNRQHLNHRR